MTPLDALTISLALILGTLSESFDVLNELEFVILLWKWTRVIGAYACKKLRLAPRTQNMV